MLAYDLSVGLGTLVLARHTNGWTSGEFHAFHRPKPRVQGDYRGGNPGECGGDEELVLAVDDRGVTSFEDMPFRTLLG